MRINICFAIVYVFLFSSCEKDDDFLPEIDNPTIENSLYIPPIIDANEQGPSITLTMQHGYTEFFEGTLSNTFGYNGKFLGPTIRVYKNQNISLTTINNIGEPTTIHKHGLHVPGNVDGGPQQRIEPGASRTDVLQIRQEASTNWYHPHLMGTTAEHVFKGLAGLLIVEDDNSQSLGLPNDYGVNDIPLIIQDRLFVKDVMTYDGEMSNEGYFGNTILVNGTLGAFKEVPASWVRIRILNGSNARFYNLSFQDNRNFQIIATDGGFLNNPVPQKSLEVWPGERFEILVDFSNSSNIKLVANSTNRGQNQEFDIIEFRPDNSIVSAGELPLNLNNIVPHNISDVVNTRTFRLNMDGVEGGLMGINGLAMNRDVINEAVSLNELERWIITSFDGKHPFHLHGASFLIVSMDGGTVPLHEKGWKDVVKVNERAEILVRFNHDANDETPYMYHCHILEHEDMGMMGQFTVK